MAYLDESGLSRLWTHIMTKLGGKVDKVDGKGLSTNDFTTAEKEKLAGLNNITVDSAMSNSSTNPVQNKTVNNALSNKAPTNHASTGTTYGIGDYNNFGHVKLIQLPLSPSEDGENWLDYNGNIVATSEELMNGTTGLAASAFAVSALSQIFSVEVDDINNQISIIAGRANSKYTKPSTGIPKTDLDSTVQASLSKADTALQNLDNLIIVSSTEPTVQEGKIWLKPVE